MTETTTPDPLDRWLADEGAEFVDRVNEEFADTVLLVAQGLSGLTDVSAATMTDIDRTGVEFLATTADGERTGRVDFRTTVDVPDHIGTALFDLAAAAQEATGSTEVTSAQRQAEALARIRTFLTTVAAVDDVHPHLRRITFRGGDLATFEPCGPDTFLYVLLPPHGRTELTIDQTFTWEAFATMPVEEQPVGAYYTLRRWDPETTELEILCVLHDHDGPGDGFDPEVPGFGAASRWAATAQVGDPVALWGPRTAYEPPEGTEHLVLVADETGLPAVAVILEQLPADTTAQVIAEVDVEDERQDLPERPGVEVAWAYRRGTPAGRTTNLVDLVRALPALPAHTYVWGGGESKAMTAVRRHVRDERALAREDVSLVAYWRHKATVDADVDAD